MDTLNPSDPRMNNLTINPAALPGKSAGGYSQPNRIMTPEVRQRNLIDGISFQGYTFNIPIGGSVQNLQLPGDCRKLLGMAASWDTTTFPGFNNVLTVAVNNQTIFNSINIMFLSVLRFLVQPGYVPLNKDVSPTSLVNLSFVNGTAAIVTSFNFIIAYQ